MVMGDIPQPLHIPPSRIQTSPVSMFNSSIAASPPCIAICGKFLVKNRDILLRTSEDFASVDMIVDFDLYPIVLVLSIVLRK